MVYSRVSRRLEFAPAHFHAKHPIILPYDHHLTTLVIRHYHQEVGQPLWPVSYLDSIRQKFRITKSGAPVKKVLNRCMLCQKWNAPKGCQIMSVLPEPRLKLKEPPFLYIGINYFGPFFTKRLKHWEALWLPIFVSNDESGAYRNGEWHDYGFVHQLFSPFHKMPR